MVFWVLPGGLPSRFRIIGRVMTQLGLGDSLILSDEDSVFPALGWYLRKRPRIARSCFVIREEQRSMGRRGVEAVFWVIEFVFRMNWSLLRTASPTVMLSLVVLNSCKPLRLVPPENSSSIVLSQRFYRSSSYKRERQSRLEDWFPMWLSDVTVY